MSTIGGQLRVYSSRLVHNARLLLDAIGPNLIAVVKGDGYGLGLVTCARAFEHAGITALAVADLNEAMTVRAAGIATRLLVLQPFRVAPLPDPSLEWVLGQVEMLQLLDDPPSDRTPIRVHLDIDLGLGRGGIPPQEVQRTLRALEAISNIHVIGLSGHLPSRPDEQRVRKAIGWLARLRQNVPDASIHVGGSDVLAWSHLADHGWLRIGRPLYGIVPRDTTAPEFDDLRYAWAWMARATPYMAPASGGYRASHRPPGQPLRIEVGYAHGLPCQAEGHWPVLVDGQRYLVHDVFMLSCIAYPQDGATVAAPTTALLSGEASERLDIRDISNSLRLSTTAVLTSPRSPRTVSAP